MTEFTVTALDQLAREPVPSYPVRLEAGALRVDV
jgi:hypothetical protein